MEDKLAVESVKGKIADLVEKYMGIERSRVLDGTPLSDLFDSLCLLELVLLVEREWSVEINIALHRPCAGVLLDIEDLAHEVVGQRAARHAVPLQVPLMGAPALGLAA